MKRLLILALSMTAELLWYSANPLRGQELIGLSFLPGETTVTVVSIDPTTGAQTPLVPTTSAGSAGGFLAVDPASRRVFFVDGISLSLYTVDLSHGTESQVPLNPCCPALAWDAAGHRLIGLSLLPGDDTVTVVAIDPTTGGGLVARRISSSVTGSTRTPAR
jgi:hypothetical protein